MLVLVADPAVADPAVADLAVADLAVAVPVPTLAVVPGSFAGPVAP